MRGDVRPQCLSDFPRNRAVAGLSELTNFSGQLGLDVPDHADLGRSVLFDHVPPIGYRLTDARRLALELGSPKVRDTNAGYAKEVSDVLAWSAALEPPVLVLGDLDNDPHRRLGYRIPLAMRHCAKQ
jgi:hypothetical protein